MRNLILPALLSAVMTFALAAPLGLSGAHAAMSDKDKCLQGLKDAKVNLSKTEDTGKPGDKIDKEAKELFPVVETLCNAGKYDEAAQLTAFLRHLLAD